jgi:hypothetical protein
MVASSILASPLKETTMFLKNHSKGSNLFGWDNVLIFKSASDKNLGL